MNTFSIISNCISASAGTGKTYRLVSRYISLLCLGATPDSLVALTFTNKAAGEFRNRIMEALAEGAGFAPTDDTPRNPLAARVIETLFGSADPAGAPAETVPLVAGLDAGLLQQAARQGIYPEDLPEIREILGHNLDSPYFCTLLESMVQQMGNLQLSTMDSFFQKLVSRNTMELGIGEVRPLMGDEEEDARREALLHMVGGHDSSEARRRAFIDLCKDISDNKVKSIIATLAADVHRNLALLQRHPDARDWQSFAEFGLPDASGLPPLAAGDWKAWEEEYAALYAQVEGDFKPNSHPHQGVTGFIGKMKAGNFSLSYVEKYLGSGDFTGPVHGALKELIGTIRDRVWLDLLRTTEVKTKGMYDLLTLYSESFRNAVVSTGRMSFDEMTRQARELLGGTAAEELTRRYRHWMLDEFQDTNTPQWEALRNLLDEVVQEDEAAAEYTRQGKTYRTSARSLFVVGDKKQGIYAFRGTNSALFSMLHGDEPPRKQEDAAYQDVLVPSSLSLSYRSAAAIMGAEGGFVNSLFSRLPVEDAEDFCHHATTRKAQGYVRVELLPKAQDTADMRENVMPGGILRILERDLTVGGSALKPGMTVAVLVRTNSDAKAIVHYLRSHMPHLPVQLAGAAEVSAASALGELLMSLFLWLQHPADTYRMNLVRLSPMGVFWQGGTADSAVHAMLVQRLDRLGYAALLRDTVFPLFPGQQDARTFDEWLTAAVEYDAGGGSLDAWIDFMARRSVKDAATTRAVQVMTMHASKGLQFDAVIIPYTGQDPVDSEDGLGYFEKPDAILLSPGASCKREAFREQLEDLTEDWHKVQYGEAMNLMYVATTRAKYANYLLLANCAKEKEESTGRGQPKIPVITLESCSEAGLITRAIAGEGKFYSDSPWFRLLRDGGVLSETGTPQWYGELAAEAASRRAESGQERESAAARPVLPLEPPAPRMRMVSPSRLHDAQVNAPQLSAHAAPAAAGNGSAADFGTAVHALFEQVEWLEDGAPLPFSPQDSPEAAVVAAALQQPDIAALFREKEGCQVLNEQDISAISPVDGSPTWISGTIDRLVLSTEGNRVAAAHIIDYKTDRRRGDTPQEQDTALRARHQAQMEAYRDLVCRAFCLEPSRVQVTLVSCPSDGAAPRTVPCPPAA